MTGLYLRAVALRQGVERDRLDALERAIGAVGRDVLIHAAFDVAINRYFDERLDERAVESFVEWLVETFGAAVSARAATIFIRGVLGADDVTRDVIQSVPAEDRVVAQMVAFGGVIYLLGDDEQVLDEILVEAERIVAGWGVQLTPADDQT